jgi:hypothetical protein
MRVNHHHDRGPAAATAPGQPESRSLLPRPGGGLRLAGTLGVGGRFKCYVTRDRDLRLQGYNLNS